MAQLWKKWLIRFSKMHNTVQILNHLVANNQVLAYLLIFLIVILEGEIIVISTGILVHLGAFTFFSALVLILFGAFCKTFLGYHIGGLIHNKWNKTKFVKYIEKRVYNIMPYFNQKPFWSIFISKFIIMNHVVMIYSGYKKIDYKKYLKAEIISTLIWAPVLLALGYFFSYTALHVSREIWRFSFLVLIFIIGFVFLDKFIIWIYELFEEFYDGLE